MSTKTQVADGAPVSSQPIAPRETAPKKAPKSTLTPAMRQYLEQKAKVGDAILLFRMGDFYETFYEDAKTIARVLGLTLTARDRNSEQPVPLAGVPYHALDRYLARLVRAGYRVAISEQLEDPRQAQGLVKRDVVRIITPGTLTEQSLLDERSDNFLVALCPVVRGVSDGDIGLACVELAGGRFFAQMLRGSDLLDELTRLRPAEVLVPERAIDTADPLMERLREGLGVAVTQRPAHIFDAVLAERSLCEHFRVSTLNGFGFDAFDASLCAAAALLDYLRETQRGALAHILRITPRPIGDNVFIDQATLRSLEVDRTMRDGSREGSLLAAVDVTVNPMGARRLRDWLCFPLRDVGRILQRQRAVTSLREAPDRLRGVRELLHEIGDMQRILARLGVGRASPRDMVGLGRALLLCADIRRILSAPDGMAGPADHCGPDLLEVAASAVAGLDDLGSNLTKAFKDDAPPVLREAGFIADGFHAELDRLRQLGREGHRFLAELQAREAQRTGIPTLKIDYNSVFGYYIEITHQHRDKVPPEYVRKQTVRNAERYITDELKRFESETLSAADRAKALEFQLFLEICARASAHLARLQEASDALATLDVLAAFAELSRRRDYCRPEFVEPPQPQPEADGSLSSLKRQSLTHHPCQGPQDSGLLEIIDGRHPVLEGVLAERFVPNDCRLDIAGDRLLIITGPNMAGKSTFIRQVALLTLLAQTGSHVPAKSIRLSPVDRIFARVGASDELARGHSTFMVEMVETARILNNATADSLVILDEIGRGTSTYDGLAIAWSVTEYLSKHLGSRTLFATHYHELTDLAGRLPGVANYNVAVKEQLRPEGTGRDVVFLHKIIPGPSDRSYGVHVAAMAGLPPGVVKRSEAILHDLERTSARRSRSRPARLEGSISAEQPLLFSNEAGIPHWLKETMESLKGRDLNQTTPLQALELLSKMQSLIRERDRGGE